MSARGQQSRLLRVTPLLSTVALTQKLRSSRIRVAQPGQEDREALLWPPLCSQCQSATGERRRDLCWAAGHVGPAEWAPWQSHSSPPGPWDPPAHLSRALAQRAMFRQQRPSDTPGPPSSPARSLSPLTRSVPRSPFPSDLLPKSVTPHENAARGTPSTRHPSHRQRGKRWGQLP